MNTHRKNYFSQRLRRVVRNTHQRHKIQSDPNNNSHWGNNISTDNGDNQPLNNNVRNRFNSRSQYIKSSNNQKDGSS
jgi:hypothetical protein